MHTDGLVGLVLWANGPQLPEGDAGSLLLALNQSDVGTATNGVAFPVFL